MIYFTSDLHFHHNNVLSLCQRPFDTIEEMNEALIHNWNSVINPKDEVYILGDFTLKRITFVPELLAQLKGRKYLIRGNHDRFARGDSFKGFEWVKDYYELKYHGDWFILCHFPFKEWNHAHRGSFHLHGHIHSKPSYNEKNIAKGKRIYDVGVDANQFKPVSLLEILEKFPEEFAGFGFHQK